MQIRCETETKLLRNHSSLNPAVFWVKLGLFSGWIRNTQVDTLAVTTLFASYCVFCFLEVPDPSQPIHPQKAFFTPLNGSLGHLYGVTAVWYANNTWSSLFPRHCGSEAGVVKLVQFTKSAHFIRLLGLASFRFSTVLFLCCCFISFLKTSLPSLASLCEH